MKRIIKGASFAFILGGLLFVTNAGAQTITASSCSANAVATALGSVSADGTTVIVPACPSGVGWGQQSAFTSGNATVNANGQLSYTPTHSVVLQGQGNTVGSDSLGNPTGYNDQTVLIYNVSAGQALIQVSMAAGKSFRMTGITINEGTGSTTNGVINISGKPQSIPCTGASGACLRIDHNHLNDLNSVFGVIGDWTWGVADHNLMNFSADDTNGFRVFADGYNNDSIGLGDQSWAGPLGLGSATAFFIEDNTVIQSNTGTIAAINDCVAGGREVIRYNTMSGGNIYVETHPIGNPYRGCFSTEVYGNVANETGTSLSPQPFHTSRSGVSMVWGNTLTDYGEVMNVFYDFDGKAGKDIGAWPNGNYGYCGSTEWAGTVNTSGTTVTATSGSFVNPNGSDTVMAGTMISIGGTVYTISSYNSSTSVTLTASAGTQTGSPFFIYSPWAQNPTGSGYACLDQPGRGPGDLMGGNGSPWSNRVDVTAGNIAKWPNQALTPIYVWDQTIVSGASSYFATESSTFMAENRDYYLELPNAGEPSSSFNGTTGVGQGLLSARPSSCTPRVAYWATDANTLYQCSATNTWSAYYTPYTYPHPLAATVPQPPSNVQAIAH